MGRTFKSMAEAETAYNAIVKERDLLQIAANVLSHGRDSKAIKGVFWHTPRRARALGAPFIGLAKITSPHGGIVVFEAGECISRVVFLDDFLREVEGMGETALTGYYRDAAWTFSNMRMIANAPKVTL